MAIVASDCNLVKHCPTVINYGSSISAVFLFKMNIFLSQLTKFVLMHYMEKSRSEILTHIHKIQRQYIYYEKAVGET